jgi:hypothetical protein
MMAHSQPKLKAGDLVRGVMDRETECVEDAMKMVFEILLPCSHAIYADDFLAYA